MWPVVSSTKSLPDAQGKSRTTPLSAGNEQLCDRAHVGRANSALAVRRSDRIPTFGNRHASKIGERRVSGLHHGDTGALQFLFLLNATAALWRSVCTRCRILQCGSLRSGLCHL